MYDVLFAFPQLVRCSNNVKLLIGVICLPHDLNIFGLVTVSGELRNICKTLIDLHVNGMQRNIIRILRHVYQNFDLNKSKIFLFSDRHFKILENRDIYSMKMIYLT